MASTQELKQVAAGGPQPADNPFLAWLGKPTYLPVNGKAYPRTIGWGADKKPDPTGGTRSQVALVVFRPFKASGAELVGKVYCERLVENGEKIRRFSVSIPFITIDRKDAQGQMALKSLKRMLREGYRLWAKSADGSKVAIQPQDVDHYDEKDDE